MKHTVRYVAGLAAFVGLSALMVACEKDYVAPEETQTPTATSASFVEQFNNVGDLSGKGWVFKNNSNPIGQAGWRQGRYEAATVAQYKFLAPVGVIGFQAYNSSTSPTDFVSVDASAGSPNPDGSGNISAWLISPPLPIDSGDQIIFYTRAVNDFDYSVYTRDRMQVRANFANGSADVGSTPTSTGRFDSVLLDINPTYVNNDPGGYPQNWRKYTITIRRIAAPIPNARFAFRYMATNASVFGGTSGANYPSVVGVDSLAFINR